MWKQCSPAVKIINYSFLVVFIIMLGVMALERYVLHVFIIPLAVFATIFALCLTARLIEMVISKQVRTAEGPKMKVELKYHPWGFAYHVIQCTFFCLLMWYIAYRFITS